MTLLFFLAFNISLFLCNCLFISSYFFNNIFFWFNISIFFLSVIYSPKTKLFFGSLSLFLNKSWVFENSSLFSFWPKMTGLSHNVSTKFFIRLLYFCVKLLIFLFLLDSYFKIFLFSLDAFSKSNNCFSWTYKLYIFILFYLY